MNATTQIAQVLDVSPNQIKSVREMAWVYCVVVYGQRATFVSKKKVDAVKVSKQVVSATWQQGGLSAKIEMKNGQYVLTVSNGKTYSYSPERFAAEMQPEVMAAGGCTEIEFVYA